jgi:hypothetical protein
MTRENFPVPPSREEHPRVLHSNPSDSLNRNRLFAMITILAMLLISALFGYRLEIGPSGLTFEHIENGAAPKSSMHKS